MSYCGSAKPYCADETYYCGSANAYCGGTTSYCVDANTYCGSVNRYCADETYYFVGGSYHPALRAPLLKQEGN
jgi:hypothetical protein